MTKPIGFGNRQQKQLHFNVGIARRLRFRRAGEGRHAIHYGQQRGGDVASNIGAPEIKKRITFLTFQPQGVEARAKVVEIVKSMATAKAKEWGKFEFEETKIGRLEHKIEKLQIVKLVPGVEWIKPYGLSGDHGITLEEYTPFGVIGAILPVTHSVPTLSGNIINIVAAGNAVVFNPHPGGARSGAMASGLGTSNAIP